MFDWWQRLWQKDETDKLLQNTEVVADRQLLQTINIPKHIAIIMDGNGRWAKRRGMPRTMGHKAGAERLRDIVREADALGVGAITAYAFSTENWKRPEAEVQLLMLLIEQYLGSELAEFMAKNVRVRFIGERDKLPEAVLKSMVRAEEKTAANTGLVLNLAINYGGRAEIMRSIVQLAGRVERGEIKAGELTEADFEAGLDTAGLPDPDLLIRPGGDSRISNFLLWQIAYTEIYLTDVFWPDFTPEHLRRAIASYQTRERRFGGLKST